ncbi:DUF2613 domain-containing protein [Nocardia sp. NPDC059180]|uniref:DUF2613 domain-containing protein n=1 Tax=Nocardia sp. NPDC059180 TaxID=3346761 RepID=UPI00369EE9B0
MKFAFPGLLSGLAGVTLGVIAVFGITAGVQQNSIPPLETAADPGSSQLGDVAYGSR